MDATVSPAEAEIVAIAARIQPPDLAAAAEARDRQAQLTKPAGALGRLEDLAIAIAGLTGSVRPRWQDRLIVVFAADHGVAAEGVSAYPSAVTPQMVLSFARGIEGERAIIQVKHPLNEVIKIAKDIFPPTITIRSKVDKELWAVNGDPTQLHQVFMNLFVNARDAMPHGGRLQVEASNTLIDENYARMQPEANAGPFVVVSVSDSGTGIAPALGLLSAL